MIATAVPSSYWFWFTVARRWAPLPAQAERIDNAWDWAGVSVAPASAARSCVTSCDPSRSTVPASSIALTMSVWVTAPRAISARTRSESDWLR